MTWPAYPLGQVLALEYGSALKGSDRKPSGRIPVAGSNGIAGYHSKALVKGPGIVVGRKGSAGEVTWFDGDFWPIDTTYYIRLLVPCQMRWIYYLLQSLRLKAYSVVTGVPGLNRNDAYKIQISLPSPSEQRRIVEILDQADALRKKRVEVDAKSARILPSLFYKMFGDPIRNSMNWNVVPFEKFGDCRLGKMLDAKQQTGMNPRPYLRNVNVRWGRIDIADILHMDFDPEERGTLRLRSGDVLICEGGEVGRAAIWYDELPECYFQKALHRLRPYPDQVTSEFVQCLMWMLSKRGGLHDATSQLTIAHLTGIKLKAMRVIQPPVPLQEEFSARVHTIRKGQQLCDQRNTAVEKLFESLLHHAFAGNLTAKWREAHMKELQAEMEQQSKLLSTAC